MKASATLANLDSHSCKPIIERNLSKILDVRIVEIDVKNHKLQFVCDTQKTLYQVKQELDRIGYPIQDCHFNYSYHTPKSRVKGDMKL